LEPASAKAGTADELDVDQSLDSFLREVQSRALAIARLATGSADDALDLVQDAMTAFVRRYRDKPADQRRPLFYRTLNNRIVDWHRRNQRWRRWLMPWRHDADNSADGPDPVARSAAASGPAGIAGNDEFGRALDAALRRLPARQRQVFLLRAWEGLKVAETAAALGISGGSVKTHYFRALTALREALEEFDE